MGFALVFICVSYWLVSGVYNNGSIAKAFTLGIFMPIIFSFLSVSRNLRSIEKVQGFIEKEVSFSGTVDSLESGNRVVVSQTHPDIGKVIVKNTYKNVLHTGQICIFKGELVEPENFEDFDYKKYLYQKGIYSILNVSSYTCEEKEDLLLSIRSKLSENIQRNMPEPESSLLIGIILGTKREFTEEFDTAVRNAGVSHIVAASGYNVSILTITIESIFRFLNRKSRALLEIVCVWIYTIISGLSPSLLRASVMASIYLFSLVSYRSSSRHISVLLCLSILISADIFVIFDIGFLLSFLSTISLIYFLPCIDSKKIGKHLKAYLLPTFSCTLFTIPLTISVFKTLSLTSIVTNFLVLPIIESTMIFGVISLLLKDIFVIPYLQLHIFKYIIESIGSIQSLKLNSNPVIISIVLYMMLILFCVYKYPIKNEEKNFYIKKSKAFFEK